MLPMNGIRQALLCDARKRAHYRYAFGI